MTIPDGTGLLRSDGSGNWIYDTNTFFQNTDVAGEVDDHLNSSTASNNQVLSYDTSISDYVWVDSGSGGGIALSDLSVGTPSPASGSGSLAYDDLNGVFTFTPPDLSQTSGNFTVGDNLSIQGSASDGGQIILNSAQTGTPTSSNTNWSYLTVERGTQPNVHIRWNEGNNVWEFTNDGTNYSGLGGDTPTLDSVLGQSDESSRELTLFRTIDGNVANGTLRFESRDVTPQPNQSMGDIRFFMDNDASVSTSTLGEYARISAKGQQVTSGTPANNTGYIDFQTSTKDGLDSLMKVGFDPFSAPSNSSGANIGTVMTNNAYVNGRFHVFEEVDTSGDLTSDANIAMYLTAYDSQTNTTQNRVEINHQNGVMRIIHRNRNDTSEFGQLTIPHSEPTPLRIYYSDTGNQYDIVSDHNFENKFNTRMSDDDTLVRFNAYANTKVITTSNDFGDFNGGSSGNAEIVPTNAGFGALAFFTFANNANGDASTHRYTPYGFTEELVHGMGILRDSSQHSLGAARWDPFGGPDFRISVDNSGQVNYLFGGTSITNDDQPVMFMINNADFSTDNGTTLSTLSFRGSESTFTDTYKEYASIVTIATDTTVGSYDGSMKFNVAVNGTGTTALELSSLGVTFNKITTEKTNALTGATGTVTHDLDNGAIFDHTSLAADFTANFTNVPTTNSRTIGISLILTQGGTAYMPTAVQIDGAAQTILWQGGSAPSGTASGTDIVSFTLIRSSGGAWKVLGSATSYS